MAEPAIFAHDEALVELGVGKNMVRSIRHWCLATSLVEETAGAGQARRLQPTPLARKLLLQGGWDPFLENTATLWLLHWQLASNQARSLVWHLIFSGYLEAEFTKKQLTAYVWRQIEQANIQTTAGAIEREVDCCLRTYVSVQSSRGDLISEEGLECPLTELDLIRYRPEDGFYRFNVGPKLSLLPPVFGYALLHYLAPIVKSRRTVAVEECIYQYGSPGQAFKLDENSVVAYLESMDKLTNGRVRLQETAGLRQLYLHDINSQELTENAVALLHDFYG